MRGASWAMLVAAVVAGAPAAAQDRATGYRGFVIDTAAIAGDAPDRAALVEAARAQIDLMLKVGLSEATLAVLRTYAVHLGRGPGGGHFGPDGVSIDLPPQPDPRPILLHEMMHAYQARLLPEGGRNAALRGFFAAAHAPGLWPAGSYMLSNINEFFAMTASVFLNGSAARPPFTRAALEAKQPDYAAWLARTIR